MAFSDDIAKLSRSESILIKLNLDNPVAGGDWISMGNTPPNSGNSIYPCVQDIKWVPARATADGGLGYFADLVITAQDFLWNQGDESQGTFFGRMIGANPYTLNRIIRMYVGYYEIGDVYNLSNYEIREYFIKRIDGPTDKGIVKIYASDAVSRMTESEIPAATSGNLNASLTDVATGSTNIVDNTGFSALGGYATIDDEIVAYSGITGGDSITISARAQGGTVAEEHDADAPVRNIYQYSGNVVNAIRDIIINHTDIDHGTYLPDTLWNAQRDNFLASEDAEIWITEPENVGDVIDDLCKEFFINVWWDDVARAIQLQALGPSLTGSISWTQEEHLLDMSIKIKREQKKVLTQVWYYHGKINQVEDADAENLERIEISINNTTETALGEERIEKIFSKYVPSGGSGTASKVGTRLLDQYAIPIEMTVHVDVKDSEVNLGDAISIETDLIQGSDGIRLPTVMRVIEKQKKKDSIFMYKLVKTGQESGTQYRVIAPNTMNDYTAESTENQAKYAFIADNDNEMSNGDDPTLIL